MANGKYEVVFGLSLAATWEAVRRRMPSEAWEAESLFALPDAPDALSAWLSEHVQDTVPPGLAGLLLHMRAAHDDTWYQDALGGIGFRPTSWPFGLAARGIRQAE